MVQRVEDRKMVLRSCGWGQIMATTDVHTLKTWEYVTLHSKRPWQMGWVLKCGDYPGGPNLTREFSSLEGGELSLVGDRGHVAEGEVRA